MLETRAGQGTNDETTDDPEDEAVEETDRHETPRTSPKLAHRVQGSADRAQETVRGEAGSRRWKLPAAFEADERADLFHNTTTLKSHDCVESLQHHEHRNGPAHTGHRAHEGPKGRISNPVG